MRVTILVLVDSKPFLANSRDWDTPFIKNIRPNKEGHLKKTDGDILDHTFFIKFSLRHIQSHHYKRFQLNNYGMIKATASVLLSNTAQIALKHTTILNKQH